MIHTKIIKRLIFLFVFLAEFTSSIAQIELKFIEKIKNYQHSVKIYGYTNDKIDTSTFNLKKYLNLFDKLIFDKNIKYNYIYYRLYRNFQSKPFIYVAKDTFNLENYIQQETLKSITTDTIFTKYLKTNHPKPFEFLNKEEKPKSIEKIIYNENSYNIIYQNKLFKFLNDSSNRAYKFVIPEDSKEGYFQYLYFQMYGEKFAPDNISLKKEETTISSSVEIESIINDFSDKEKYLSPQVKKLKKLELIDLNPLVTIDSLSCTISWIEFKESVGVYKREYKISRRMPHKIVKHNEVSLYKVNPASVKYEVIY